MKTVTLPLPMFGFIVATRAALGVGLGLLVADRLPQERRRTAGAMLVAIGALTTIPAAAALTRSFRRTRLIQNQPGRDDYAQR
jgi:multisubunit Na+/H+ antiporter MnhB subunit